MRVFWKVHIDNFNDFERFMWFKYKNFTNKNLHYFKSFYRESEYLYLFIGPSNYSHTEYQMTYSYYSEIFDPDKISVSKYMGEYNLSKERLYKLKRLNSI